MTDAEVREADILDQIDELDRLADAAQAAGGWSAAVSARVKIAALRADLARLRDEVAAEAETDPLERIRRLRRRAAEDGSWTAAASLLKQEQEMIEARKKAEEDLKKAARKGMTEDELIESLVSRIGAMPEKMRRKVLDRLSSGSVAIVN